MVVKRFKRVVGIFFLVLGHELLYFLAVAVDCKVRSVNVEADSEPARKSLLSIETLPFPAMDTHQKNNDVFQGALFAVLLPECAVKRPVPSYVQKQKI